MCYEGICKKSLFHQIRLLEFFNYLFTSIYSFKTFIDMATSSMLSQDATSPLVQIASFPRLIRILYDMYFELLDHYEIIKNYVGTKEVDAVTLTAFFPENGLYLSHYFKCPTILLSPIGPVPHFSHYFGNPENPSYMPDTRMPFIEPMNFRARFFNTLYYAFLDILNIQQRLMGQVLSSHQLMEYEEFIQSYQKMSLLLENSHFVTHNSQAKVANTVNIGGVHCREGKPLPQDLSNFLDQAKSGAIYVSFGSVIKSSLMSKEKLDSFLETFRQIKYPVIWKWDADQIPNLSANVMLKKWLPQQDLLAHQNLKVFVTHGGIFSLQEALYHNTPLVGIPLGTDQKPNLMRAQQRGYALMLDWQSLNTSVFTDAINKVMRDLSFANNMNTAHNQFIDQKETPLERGIWWIEYVIRHKGAQFLKPLSLKLTFYQYHLLDVISLLVLIAIISSIVFIILLKCCCKLWCSRSSTKQKVQ